MTALLKDDTELFKQFSDNDSSARGSPRPSSTSPTRNRAGAMDPDRGEDGEPTTRSSGLTIVRRASSRAPELDNVPLEEH